MSSLWWGHDSYHWHNHLSKSNFWSIQLELMAAILWYGPPMHCLTLYKITWNITKSNWLFERKKNILAKKSLNNIHTIEQWLWWQSKVASHLCRNQQLQSLEMFYLIKDEHLINYDNFWNKCNEKWNKPSPISSAIMHLPPWLIPKATPYFWNSSNCELIRLSIAWRHMKSGSCGSLIITEFV